MRVNQTLSTGGILLLSVLSGHVQALDATLIGRYDAKVFDESASEIVSFHAESKRIFVVNAKQHRIDVLDGSKLTSHALETPLHASNLALDYFVDVSENVKTVALGAANSVDVHGNLMAVAVEAQNKQQPGVVAFYRLDESGKSTFLTYRQVGALPDMLTFTPDGSKVVVANEGEPSNDYKIDPEGSVSIIAIEKGEPSNTVITADFHRFNEKRNPDIRVFGPHATASQDFEPEYISLSTDSKTAYVTLQENNALAIVDLDKGVVRDVVPFGYKDFGKIEMDASDKDGKVALARRPGVMGMYQPDSIATLNLKGRDYLLTANEGDSRDYWFDADSEDACLATGAKKYDEEDGCLGYSEETRAGKLKVEGDQLKAADVSDEKVLGRLKVTKTLGDSDGNGAYERLYAFGGRSFSVWSDSGALVWDSGDQIEKITADRLGMDFNNGNDENAGDSRSDDKGAEPEGIAVGFVNEVPYAFVGLERTGGIMVYNLSDPTNPAFVTYFGNRDFKTTSVEQAGDLGPEGIKFVSAEKSPTGQALIVIGHEVSGTTTVYELR